MKKLKRYFRGSELLEQYVNKIDDLCGDGKEFIVTLNDSKKNEAIERILKKFHLKQNLSDILTKGKYKGKEVSIFKTGKIVMRDFKGKEEAKRFLEELFK